MAAHVGIFWQLHMQIGRNLGPYIQVTIVVKGTCLYKKKLHIYNAITSYKIKQICSQQLIDKMKSTAFKLNFVLRLIFMHGIVYGHQ